MEEPFGLVPFRDGEACGRDGLMAKGQRCPGHSGLHGGKKEVDVARVVLALGHRRCGPQCGGPDGLALLLCLLGSGCCLDAI